jgi:RNA polymerase I-specific transcription initiation factor RRN3
MTSLNSPSKASMTLLTPEQALARRFPGLTKRDYTMHKCTMPPPSELEPIETFVFNAIQSKHSDMPDPAHEQGYRAIIDALKRPVDPPMLRMVLIALRTAGNGAVLNRLTADALKHAQLIHWLFRFNSALRPTLAEGEENEQLVGVLKDGSLLDAHLHLVLAMVSARTVNLVPALTAIWRMISEEPDLSEDL